MKKLFSILCFIMLFASCGGLQVQNSRPMVRFNPTLNSDDSYTVDLADSLNFTGDPSDLEYQFTFFSDGTKSDQTLGYKKGSELVGDYQIIHLDNGGILYVGGTYETPVFYYVGGPAKTTVDFCATARDTISQVSTTECISLAFTSTTPPADIFTVGGTVSGLNGDLVLQNNNGDNITVNEDGTFTFPTEIAVGASYNVTVLSVPCAQRCIATVNTGIMGLGNVTNVIVTCTNKSWDDPEDILSHISLGGTAATAPDVAMNDSGDAIIAWQQSDGTNTQIYKAELINGTWIYPTNILTDRVSFPGSDVSRAKVSINNNGEAVIAWIQADDEVIAKNQIFVATRSAGGVWTKPTSLGDYKSTAGNDVSNHEVRIDAAANIVVAYLKCTKPNADLVLGPMQL
jgi:hypothetical protein